MRAHIRPIRITRQHFQTAVVKTNRILSINWKIRVRICSPHSRRKLPPIWTLIWNRRKAIDSRMCARISHDIRVNFDISRHTVDRAVPTIRIPRRRLQMWQMPTDRQVLIEASRICRRRRRLKAVSIVICSRPRPHRPVRVRLLYFKRRQRMHVKRSVVFNRRTNTTQIDQVPMQRTALGALQMEGKVQRDCGKRNVIIWRRNYCWTMLVQQDLAVNAPTTRWLWNSSRIIASSPTRHWPPRRWMHSLRLDQVDRPAVQRKPVIVRTRRSRKTARQWRARMFHRSRIWARLVVALQLRQVMLTIGKLSIGPQIQMKRHQRRRKSGQRHRALCRWRTRQFCRMQLPIPKVIWTKDNLQWKHIP